MAIPVVNSAETRTPVMITGHASGSWMVIRRCRLLRPIPRADLSTASSTPIRPVTVFRVIGSRAYIVKATNGPQKPSPTMGMNRTNSPSDGIVRNTA